MKDISKTFLGRASQFLEIYSNDRDNFTLVACLMKWEGKFRGTDA